MKKILYEKSVSYRNPPQNLETKELNLFEHEFKKEIKSSYIFFEKNIYAINTVFFQFINLVTSMIIPFLVTRPL